MGGEHKCPLCSATFTRPQHVGRHLRAHTGDRPYECKECPLRFARSDLLSRHVNKAHPKPDGQGGDKAKDKRGRRKSVSTQHPATGGISAARAAQHAPLAAPLVHPGQAPEHAAFQAQRMYPNHPLLQQNGTSSQLWAQPAFTLGHGNQFGTDVLGNLVMPAAFVPMAQEPVNPHASFDPQLAQAAPPHMGIDLTVKKRACDQCNHSKVRCDCAEPCARCAHRSIQCTYTKQQRSRGAGGFGPPITTALEPVANQQLSGISPTTGMHNSPLSATQQRMSVSDGMGTAGVAVARPPVPDPNWDATIQQTILAQHPGDNPTLHQSPANLTMSLTPALTNSTSPSTTDTSSGRRGSSGNWILPPSVIPIAPQGDFGGIQMDSIGLASSFHGSTGMFRPSSESVYESSASPNYAPTISSEDDDSSSISWTDKDARGHRRRSSASGQWAGAMNQLHLDDPQGTQGVSFDANGNMQFGYPPQQRHSTFPVGPGDLSASLSRAPSGQDVNFWKLFLDPAALASPDVQDMTFNSLDTPRGLSKSNSMPDLKTPPTVTANYVPLQFMDMSIPTGPPGVLDQQQQPPGQQQQRAHSDDTDMDRWRDHIQQRHASFSMSMGTGMGMDMVMGEDGTARKVSTGQLSGATFASGKPGMMRPPPNPLFSNAAMQQTLAPERTPSFGMGAFDQTTPKGNPRTPTAQLLSMYTALERPNNKRMASQTLVPDMFQKRQQMYVAEEETYTDSSSTSSPRRSTDLQKRASLPASGLYHSVPPTKTG